MKKLTILIALLCLLSSGYSQNTDEEKIKTVVRAETESYFNRNLDGWKATWKVDGKTNRTFISKYGYEMEDRWDSSAARMEAYFKQSPTPQTVDITYNNFDVMQKGEMAWVAYDQVLTGPAIDPATGDGLTREYRVLVKDGTDWKIVSQITTAPESYSNNNPRLIEYDLNATGYNLLGAKKINEAIEVFKMNVKLYPTSWNTYDSLGEAYELAGDKKKAIENFEKSVQLNPKNESGVTALKKLKDK